jgi:hypothetical protein
VVSVWYFDTCSLASLRAQVAADQHLTCSYCLLLNHLQSHCISFSWMKLVTSISYYDLPLLGFQHLTKQCASTDSIQNIMYSLCIFQPGNSVVGPRYLLEIEKVSCTSMVCIILITVCRSHKCVKFTYSERGDADA